MNKIDQTILSLKLICLVKKVLIEVKNGRAFGVWRRGEFFRIKGFVLDETVQ